MKVITPNLGGLRDINFLYRGQSLGQSLGQNLGSEFEVRVAGQSFGPKFIV